MAGNPRIYVACLAAFSAGILHGEWLDADQSVGRLRDAVRDMLSRSPIAGAEEYAIHDLDGFLGIEIGEHESLETVAALGEFVAEHGTIGAALYGHFGDLDEARNALGERCCGQWSSLEDWAESFLDDSGERSQVPERLRPYLDLEKYADDLELSGDIFALALDGSVLVFWAN